MSLCMNGGGAQAKGFIEGRVNQGWGKCPPTMLPPFKTALMLTKAVFRGVCVGGGGKSGAFTSFETLPHTYVRIS